MKPERPTDSKIGGMGITGIMLLFGFAVCAQSGWWWVGGFFGLLGAWVLKVALSTTKAQMDYDEEFGGEDMDKINVVGGMNRIVVQINGKYVDTLDVLFPSAQIAIESNALALDSVYNAIGDRKVVRWVHVPGKLLNIVTQ